MAATRIATRARGAEWYLALYRAHAFQGDGATFGGGHCARSGPDWRDAGRFHLKGDGVREYARAGRAFVGGLRYFGGYGNVAEVRARGDYAREVGDFGRDQDGARQSGRLDSRDVLAEFLGQRRFAGAADFGDQGHRRAVSAQDVAGVVHAMVRAESNGDYGGGEFETRADDGACGKAFFGTEALGRGHQRAEASAESKDYDPQEARFGAGAYLFGRAGVCGSG